MSEQSFFTEMKTIEESLLNFIESEDKAKENYQHLIKLFNDQKIQENEHKLNAMLHLISKICNHHRCPNFYDKIHQILQFFKPHILNNFTNLEIFRIFIDNKLLLLYLFEEKYIVMDDRIASEFRKSYFFSTDYHNFFQPELLPFLKTQEHSIYDHRDSKINLKEFMVSFENDEEKSEFYKNRRIGENNDKICELIRNDSLDDFIIYINKLNISPSSYIKNSIFETNSFLLHQEEEDESVTFIEYAAFFGAIQIVKYLIANNVNSNRLLLFAIHSNNYELIQMLETDSTDYKEIFDMAIQCHHNEVANYIKTNHLENDGEIDDDSFKNCLKNYNFSFIQPKKIDIKYLEALCLYDYSYVLDIILKTNNIDVNDMIVLKFYNFSILF
ncbi:hypothetical protein M9Y10_026359 [Tritrichomonas musculus]|uniref:DUF3447 domain-containing protein n=1 Tax=Tritrichomonas musculus TaxID=1915356 RepID=A0ABR2H990_9EUKA